MITPTFGRVWLVSMFHHVKLTRDMQVTRKPSEALRVWRLLERQHSIRQCYEAFVSYDDLRKENIAFWNWVAYLGPPVPVTVLPQEELELVAMEYKLLGVE